MAKVKVNDATTTTTVAPYAPGDRVRVTGTEVGVVQGRVELVTAREGSFRIVASVQQPRRHRGYVVVVEVGPDGLGLGVGPTLG